VISITTATATAANTTSATTITTITTINTTTTTVLWPLYHYTRQHVLAVTIVNKWRFCWSKVLLATCPC